MNLSPRFLPPLAALLLLPVSSFAQGKKPARVRTQLTPAGWQLIVDGKPFYVKGIACNDGLVDGIDYLKMAADAGANAVRVYGDVTKEYLDLAHRHGLKVNAGFWTNAIRLGTKESYRDAQHTAALKERALSMVRQFKGHPAVLTWTMGNEVFFFSQPDEEKEAYGRFLEDLVQAIHKEDPDHPVIYSSAYTNCLPYLKKYVPSIDIIGVNVTGGAGPATQWAQKNDFDRPVLVTEFAPLGAWEMRKDPNGMPYDPFDHLKADGLLSSWRQMQANPRSCVGGFAFVLGGFRNQDSLTWFNMNYERYKRASYWTMSELYTGKKPANRPPKISTLSVQPVSNLKPGDRAQVKVTAKDPEDDPLSYEYFLTNIANDPLIVEKPTFFRTDVQATQPGIGDVAAPQEPGIYRIYVAIRDGRGNIAIGSRTIQVTN